MSELFLTVLNMSITASYVILFVIIVRLLLKKAPKFISYVLWGVVAFRLIIPFSFESVFSFMPRNTNAVPIPPDIIYQQSPRINSGIEVVDSFVNDSLPVPTVGASVNPLQIYVEIGAHIWVLGMIALLIISIVSVMLLKKQLKGAQLIEKNIYEADNLKTPFVLGLINPKIYLPIGLSEEERNYILLHEQTHIHRKDHIIKVLAFLILSVHWFNPFVWIAFILMSTDMEMSCDEKVLKAMNENVKKPYANTLLSLAAGRHVLNGSPLAFGEGNVKGRIKNILNYKKPKFWVIAVSIILVVTVGTGLTFNPKADGLKESEQITDTAQQEDNSDLMQTAVEPVAPKLSLEQDLGGRRLILNYASADIVIFHSYFGLFVYDLNTLQIIRSIDLKPLNCHMIQGDNYCDVSVSLDGNTVYLHPIQSENMYIYTVSNHTLQEAVYKPMEDSFKSQIIPIEEAVNPVKGNYSYHAVKFDTGEYGYLYSSDWTLGTLSLCCYSISFTSDLRCIAHANGN